MPKAAAVQPSEWATIHDSFTPFDIGALNRVVLDYAHVELTLAGRWYRRTALGRAVAAAGFAFTILSLCAAVALGLIMLTGAVDNAALLPVAWAGAGLSACAILGFFVPWVLTPYRQWDRTLNGIAVMIVVIAALSLGAALVRRWEAASNAALAVPFILLAVFAVGVIVVHARLRATGKPPAVDVASLSPSDIAVLRKARQRALKILRHRNVVAYKDFDGYDNAPFTAGDAGTAYRSP
jgi:apolipoprotein N-acyltransferase